MCPAFPSEKGGFVLARYIKRTDRQKRAKILHNRIEREIVSRLKDCSVEDMTLLARQYWKRSQLLLDTHISWSKMSKDGFRSYAESEIRCQVRDFQIVVK